MLSEMEREMLSGEPFTLRDMVRRYSPDDDRVVDRVIQKHRKLGHISYARVGRDVLWSATDAGRAALKEGGADAAG